MQPNTIKELKRIIEDGLFPSDYRLFEGTGIVITYDRDDVEELQKNGISVLKTQHAGVFSWFVFQLKDIYGEKINASNKFEFYNLITDSIIGEMNKSADPIQAMLVSLDNVLTEFS